MTRIPSEPAKLVEIPISFVPCIEGFIEQGGVGSPFYESMIPGGFPSPAQDSNYQTINILSMIIPHPEQTILVRMPDDSLENEGIFQDDILIAEKDAAVKDGDIIVGRSEGEVCLCRLGPDFLFDIDGIEIIAVVRYRIHTLYGEPFFT